MSVFKHSMLIERPIEEVFAFLHGPANDPFGEPASWNRGSQARCASLAEPVFARMASRELEAIGGHLKDPLETASS